MFNPHTSLWPAINRIFLGQMFDYTLYRQIFQANIRYRRVYMIKILPVDYYSERKAVKNVLKQKANNREEQLLSVGPLECTYATDKQTYN